MQLQMQVKPCKVRHAEKVTIEYTTPKHTIIQSFWFCFEPRSRIRMDETWKSYKIMIDYWYYLHCTLARWCSGNWRCFGPVFSVISCSGREMQGGVARCYAASQCNLLHDWMVSRTCTHLVKLRLLFNRMLQALQIMALTVPEHTTNQNARMVKKEVRVHRTCTVQVTYPFLQVDHTAFDWKAVPTRAQHPQIRSRSYCKDNPGWAYSREAVVWSCRAVHDDDDDCDNDDDGDDDGDDVDDDVDDE